MGDLPHDLPSKCAYVQILKATMLDEDLANDGTTPKYLECIEVPPCGFPRVRVVLSE